MIFDLYGFKISDIENARQLIEKALNVKFIVHESSYLGDYYKVKLNSNEDYMLQHNFLKHDEDWMEPQFTEYPLLLYINGTSRSEEIEEILKNKISIIHFLRHKIV